MLRLALIVWIISGTVFAGVAVLVVLAVDSLASQAMSLIGPLAAAGFVLALPAAIVVAKKIGPTAARS